MYIYIVLYAAAPRPARSYCCPSNDVSFADGFPTTLHDVTNERIGWEQSTYAETYCIFNIIILLYGWAQACMRS